MFCKYRFKASFSIFALLLCHLFDGCGTEGVGKKKNNIEYACFIETFVFGAVSLLHWQEVYKI